MIIIKINDKPNWKKKSCPLGKIMFRGRLENVPKNALYITARDASATKSLWDVLRT